MGKPTAEMDGGIVRSTRKAMGLSQEKLAKQLGVHIQTVRRAERGIGSFDVAKKFANGLEIPVEHLLLSHHRAFREKIRQALQVCDRGRIAAIATAAEIAPQALSTFISGQEQKNLYALPIPHLLQIIAGADASISFMPTDNPTPNTRLPETKLAAIQDDAAAYSPTTDTPAEAVFAALIEDPHEFKKVAIGILMGNTAEQISNAHAIDLHRVNLYLTVLGAMPRARR